MKSIFSAIIGLSLLGAAVACAGELEKLATIEGRCTALNGLDKSSISHLLVDAIDGKKLAKPRVIMVSGVRFPVDERFKVRGYNPVARAHALIQRRLAAGELPDDVGPSKVIGLEPKCQIVERFVPVEIIAPANLPLPEQEASEP